MYPLFLCILLFATTAVSWQNDITGSDKAEKIFQLKAGNTTMKISANGGRIISFRLGNNELITNKSEHENFGSTLWTAPQSDWGWPPYRVLDSEEYDFQQIGDTLKMTSEPDLISGLQFEKKFIVKDNQYIRIEYLIRNVSEKQQKIAPWEVTRVPCGGMAFFPADGKANIPASSLKTNLSNDRINWVFIDKTTIPEHQKLFATAREGWLAYAYNNVLFIKQFPDTKPGDYSPNQGEVEIYTNKDKMYAELENHGAYTLLQPEQVLSYVVNWQLRAIPKTVIGDTENTRLFLFAREQVTIINNTTNISR